MSYTWQDKAWKLKLDASSKAVILALCFRANEDGECWPSLAGISELTGLNVKTVKSVLPSLVARGLIEKESGHGVKNKYKLLDSGFDLAQKLPSPKTDQVQKRVDPNLDQVVSPKADRVPSPKLGHEQVNNKSYNKSDIYIAEKTDIFAPIGEQVSELQADHVIDLQDQPERILTALEMRSLARVNRINLNCTERLKEVANRQSVTTEIFLECVKEYQKTPRSPGWLVGMLDNVSRDTDKFLTQVRERSRPNAFVQDLIDSGLL